MEPHVTVLVPTLRRPELLRSALSSIASQSRLDLVAEVIVSENSDDTRSREVCGEFPQLPIRWVNRSPTISPYAHFRAIAPLASAPWIAWHGDDDLWGRYHLQEAARCLAARPESIAYVPGFAFVRNESCRPLVATQQTVEGILAGYQRELRNEILIGPEQMFLETLVQVPFNFWSLVARKELTIQSLARWHDHSGWDADRLFFWDLSLRGPIVHSREITMFHRSHPVSTSAAHDKHREEWARMSAEHTRQIITEAEAAGLQPRKLWQTTWDQMSDWQRAYLVTHSLSGVIEMIREVWGDEVCRVPEQPALKRLVRDLCPPMLWQFLHSAKKRMRPPPPGQPALHEKPASIQPAADQV